MKQHSKLIYCAALLPLIFSPVALADQVIEDDLIVDGSACVGSGCTNEEIFNFDTLKVKAPTPLIKFLDTSTSSSFPSSDWSMGVEDDGASSLFFIKHINTDTTVMRMSAGANGGVALGAGSGLEDDAVSVGAFLSPRRIAHVADGVDPTDAVNKGQLDAGLATINGRIDALILRVEALEAPLP